MTVVRTPGEFRAWLDAHPEGGVVTTAGTITFSLHESVRIPAHTWVTGARGLGLVHMRLSWYWARLRNAISQTLYKPSH